MDLPPSCNPALAPPMEYIAGGDHLPLKLLPSRQTMGPRPPVPPIPTANFFTLGRMMMQLALASTLGGISLLASMAWRTVVALRMVSSSSALLAPHAGSVTSARQKDASIHSADFLVGSMSF